MKLTQVSAFMENRPGRLLNLLNVLADNGINLIAHNIVDASDFGIIHILVDDADKTVRAIRSAGITCSTTTVLGITVPDEPGAFAHQVLKPLMEAGINIEYSYAYSEPTTGEARIVIKVDDTEAAVATLSD